MFLRHLFWSPDEDLCPSKVCMIYLLQDTLNSFLFYLFIFIFVLLSQSHVLPFPFSFDIWKNVQSLWYVNISWSTYLNGVRNFIFNVHIMWDKHYYETNEPFLFACSSFKHWILQSMKYICYFNIHFESIIKENICGIWE